MIQIDPCQIVLHMHSKTCWVDKLLEEGLGVVDIRSASKDDQVGRKVVRRMETFSIPRS